MTDSEPSVGDGTEGVEDASDTNDVNGDTEISSDEIAPDAFDGTESNSPRDLSLDDEQVREAREQSELFRGYNAGNIDDVVEALEDIEPAAAETVREMTQDKERLEQEAMTLRTRIQETKEEYNSYQTRKEKQIEALKQTAAKDFIKKILPIRDDIEHIKGELDDGVTLEGIEMVAEEFDQKLEDEGVTIIQPEGGAPYNPDVHDVISRVEVSELEDGTIAKCHRSGYQIEDLVLQPARVSVVQNE